MSLPQFDQIQASSDTLVLSAGADGMVMVPDAALLFNAQFERSGHDLVLTNEGSDTLRILNYFAEEAPADLHAPNGAVLRGDLVERLAGPLAPGQYAQAGPGAALPSPVGQVETSQGDATVQRTDGTIEPLSVGAKIFEDDVVQTGEGSTVSVTFVDGTVFSLSAGSRMVIDELIYDPDSTNNSGTIDLIQGSFVFIAGQVARTGGMDVNTPSATMGIRGTTVIVEIQTVNGIVTSEVTLTNDPNGHVGRVVMRDLSGNVLADITGTDTKWMVSSDGDGAREVDRTDLDEANDSVLIADAVAAYQSAYARFDVGKTFVDLGGAAPAPQGNNPTGGPDSGLGVDGIDEDPSIAPPEQQEPKTNETDTFDQGSLDSDLPFKVEELILTGNEDPEEGDPITGNIPFDVKTGGAPEFVIETEPGNGAVVLDPDGSFAFLPNENFNGRDSFTYTATNAQGVVEVGTVIVIVKPVNDEPVIEDAQFGGAEDGAIRGVLAGSDVDGDVLRYSLKSGAGQGLVVLLQDGNFVYTPNSNFNGTDSFTVRISDGKGGVDVAQVVLDVRAVNDVPVIAPSSAKPSDELVENLVTSTSGQLRATDGDAGDVLVWSGSGVGKFGSFELGSDGNWTYTLNAASERLSEGQTVAESFVATVTDGQGASASQKVTISILGKNDAAVITGTKAGTVSENSAVSSVSGNLDHTDVDNNNLADVFRSVLPGTPSAMGYGTFAVTAAGIWTFTLNNGNAAVQALTDGKTLTDFFIVRAQDGTPQQVTVTINGSDDAAVITGVKSGVIAANSLSGIVGGDLNHTDADGGFANDVFQIVAPGSASANGYGTYAVNSSGVWTYSLDQGNTAVRALSPGATLTDTFTVRAEDGTPQIVTVTIKGTNDAPVVTTADGEDKGTVIEGDEIVSAEGQLSAIDYDSGDTATWSLGGPAKGAYGTFTISADGKWSYTLDNAAAEVLSKGEIAQESFTAIVRDTQGGSTVQTVTIEVVGTNDNPVVVRNTVTEVEQGGSVSGLLLASDADSASWTFSLGSTGPAHGSVTIAADGSYTYTPFAGYAGLDQFLYDVTDTDGGVTTARVTVGIQSDVSDDGTHAVTVGINTVANPDGPAGSVNIGSAQVDPTSVNLIFALDRSGSISGSEWSLVKSTVADTIRALAAQFSGSSTTVDVQIIPYSTSVTNLPSYDLQDPDLISAILGLSNPSGSTNWVPVFDKAAEFLAQQPGGETSYMFFLTDGIATDAATWQSAYNSLMTENPTLNIEAFGIGNAFNLANLQIIDTNGDPTALASAGDLEAALNESPVFQPQLVGFQLSLLVDGVDLGVIADQSSPVLVADGLDYHLSFADIDGIADLLGEENFFGVSVQFDVDGNAKTAEINLFSSEFMGMSSTAKVLNGLEGNDLLFGSSQADEISGGGGSDILLGYDGNDTLIGGLGDDTVFGGDGNDLIVVNTLTGDRIDGGAGRDVLAFSDAGNIGAGLLPTLDISNIEALDMANGLANRLSLTVDDVINLSATSDTELETLLSRALPDSATVYGDSSDTLDLKNSAGGQFQLSSGGPVSDGSGNSFDVYEYVQGGNVLATLAVDDNVNVTLVPVA